MTVDDGVGDEEAVFVGGEGGAWGQGDFEAVAVAGLAVGGAEDGVDNADGGAGDAGELTAARVEGVEAEVAVGGGGGGVGRADQLDAVVIEVGVGAGEKRSGEVDPEFFGGSRSAGGGSGDGDFVELAGSGDDGGAGAIGDGADGLDVGDVGRGGLEVEGEDEVLGAGGGGVAVDGVAGGVGDAGCGAGGSEGDQSVAAGRQAGREAEVDAAGEGVSGSGAGDGVVGIDGAGDEAGAVFEGGAGGRVDAEQAVVADVGGGGGVESRDEELEGDGQGVGELVRQDGVLDGDLDAVVERVEGGDGGNAGIGVGCDVGDGQGGVGGIDAEGDIDLGGETGLRGTIGLADDDDAEAEEAVGQVGGGLEREFAVGVGGGGGVDAGQDGEAAAVGTALEVEGVAVEGVELGNDLQAGDRAGEEGGDASDEAGTGDVGVLVASDTGVVVGVELDELDDRSAEDDVGEGEDEGVVVGIFAGQGAAVAGGEEAVEFAVEAVADEVGDGVFDADLVVVARELILGDLGQVDQSAVGGRFPADGVAGEVADDDVAGLAEVGGGAAASEFDSRGGDGGRVHRLAEADADGAGGDVDAGDAGADQVGDTERAVELDEGAAVGGSDGVGGEPEGVVAVGLGTGLAGDGDGEDGGSAVGQEGDAGGCGGHAGGGLGEAEVGGLEGGGVDGLVELDGDLGEDAGQDGAVGGSGGDDAEVIDGRQRGQGAGDAEAALDVPDARGRVVDGCGGRSEGSDDVGLADAGRELAHDGDQPGEVGGGGGGAAEVGEAGAVDVVAGDEEGGVGVLGGGELGGLELADLGEAVAGGVEDEGARSEGAEVGADGGGAVIDSADADDVDTAGVADVGLVGDAAGVAEPLVEVEEGSLSEAGEHDTAGGGAAIDVDGDGVVAGVGDGEEFDRLLGLDIVGGAGRDDGAVGVEDEDVDIGDDAGGGEEGLVVLEGEGGVGGAGDQGQGGEDAGPGVEVHEGAGATGEGGGGGAEWGLEAGVAIVAGGGQVDAVLLEDDLAGGGLDRSGLVEGFVGVADVVDDDLGAGGGEGADALGEGKLAGDAGVVGEVDAGGEVVDQLHHGAAFVVGRRAVEQDVDPAQGGQVAAIDRVGQATLEAVDGGGDDADGDAGASAIGIDRGEGVERAGQSEDGLGLVGRGPLAA